MTSLKSLAATPLALALAACVVVPVQDMNNVASCNTYTKSMTLKTVTASNGNWNCHDEVCLAAILAVSAGSLIVSGSIVLINNTAHWLEYQGSCDDSTLNTAKQNFLDTLGSPKPLTAVQSAQ